MNITRREARAQLGAQSFSLVDAQGAMASLDACLLSAKCFRLESAAGDIVFALEFSQGEAWVTVAAGPTACPMSPALDAALVALARMHSCTSLGFQTARRGLVRVAGRLGWRITCPLPNGWQMERAVDEPAT
ncbi:MAG: hypothetical protein J0H69_00630 [Burkholderiales bacterium]|nr:hypothetical protein [Burkholderiales bacterium]